MISATLLAASLASHAAPPLDDVVVTARLEERRAEGGAAPPVGPMYQSLDSSEAAPEGAPSLPVEVHGPSWSTLEAGGKKVHVVLGRSSADAETLDVAFIDLDGDQAFGAGERLDLAPEPRDRDDGSVFWSGNVEGLSLKTGRAEIPFTFSYYLDPTRGVGARVVFEGWHGADVTVDGETLSLAMLDLDHDGCIGGAADRWYLYPADAPPERPANEYALSAFGEGRYHDGHRFTVEPKGCLELELRAKPADGPDPKDLAHHRERIEKLWFERFDAEREGFVASRELDESRPRAEAPIDWRYVSFEEALALGEKEGKPIFIDVMAFWCVWCYRMDYYTYVDAEVAEMLNTKFVPVKIIQEQAAEGDYDLVMREKLEARGIPAMGVFDAEGDALQKIGGWKKPEDFLEDLRAGLEAWRGAGN